MLTELPFHYQIRRSLKVSRARIVVKPGQVEIVAPWEVPEHKLHKFVHAKQAWVTQALKKMAGSNPGQHKFAPNRCISGELLTYRGQQYEITLQPSKLKRIKIEFNEGFKIYLPESMQAQDAQTEIKIAIIRWLKKEVKIDVEYYVNLHATKQQLLPRSIAIKTQKSRWGSCGIKNDININWLLLMAPPEVLEYVIVHELCHIREKNHSAQFWDLVGQHLPDFKLRRQWLKKHGRSLMMAFAD